MGQLSAHCRNCGWGSELCRVAGGGGEIAYLKGWDLILLTGAADYVYVYSEQFTAIILLWCKTLSLILLIAQPLSGRIASKCRGYQKTAAPISLARRWVPFLTRHSLHELLQRKTKGPARRLAQSIVIPLYASRFVDLVKTGVAPASRRSRATLKIRR